MSSPPTRHDWMVRARRLRQRQRPAGTGWVLIVGVVVLVLLMALYIWNRWAMMEPTDAMRRREATMEVVRGWRERWPQVPGPPARYREEARDLAAAGALAEALERAEMAAAIRPDDENLLLVAVLGAAGGGLDAETVEVLVEGGGGGMQARLLPAARAWLALAAGDPRQALQEADGEAEPTGEAMWARLRALRMLGEDPLPAARALAALWPGHFDACGVLFEVGASAAGCPGADGAGAPPAPRRAGGPGGDGVLDRDPPGE